MSKEEAKDGAVAMQISLSEDLKTISDALDAAWNTACSQTEDQDWIELTDSALEAFKRVQKLVGNPDAMKASQPETPSPEAQLLTSGSFQVSKDGQGPLVSALTAEQKYVQSLGNHCPCCGSSDITGESFNSDSGYAWQEISCFNCNATWEDSYTLTGVSITDRGDDSDNEEDDDPEDSELNACDATGILAEAHSDDFCIEKEFDATAWFKQASDDKIVALSAAGWCGGYEADEVAEFYTHSDLSELFSYLHAVNKKGTSVGFECDVDEESAMAWLKQNRPEVFARILDSEQ